MRYQAKRTAALLLSLCLLLICGIPARAQNGTKTQIGRSDHQIISVAEGLSFPKAPEINARRALLIELNSGTILFSRNMHEQQCPASLTKMLTALVAIEDGELTDTLTVSPESVSFTDPEAQDAKHRFHAGQSFSLEQGLYAFALDSVNTIGTMIAEYLDGGEEAFAVRMNEHAKKIGAINSNFRNPHGLNDMEHVTTAYDLAMILWAGIENDTWRTIFGTKEYSFTDSEGTTIECSNSLSLLQPSNQYYNPYVVAGKTGFTSDAMSTRASYSTNGELDVICVTLYSDTAWQSFEDQNRLINYAMENFCLRDVPAFDEAGRQEIELALSDVSDGKKLKLRAGEAETLTGAELLVPKRLADTEWKREIRIEEEGFSAVFTLDGAELVRYPLTAEFSEETEKPTQKTTKAAKKTTENSQSSTAAEEKPQDKPSEGGKTAKLAIIVLSVMLLLAFTVIALLLKENSRLRQRVSRRKQLSE